jgi:hypothetical protein
MPRTKITEKTVYAFDELSEHAKERARDWYRDALDPSDMESVIEDASRMADILGINLRTRPVKLMGGGTRNEPAIYWSGFSSQGDGAYWQGSYSYRKGSVKAMASEAPGDSKGNRELNRIARELRDIQRRYFYRLEAHADHKGRDSQMADYDVSVSDVEGNGVPQAVADVVGELLADFGHWIYRQLESEYEYQNSAKCVDENIRANKYEFTEEGERA